MRCGRLCTRKAASWPDDALLAPVGRPSDDINLRAARRQDEVEIARIEYRCGAGQALQIAGAKRCPSGSNAPELIVLPAPYDACEKVATKVSSLSLVRYRRNDYSAPTTYGHRDVLVRGYVHEVVISCGAEVIARHPRSYEREDFVFDPLHYLALIEQKINALDQAAPLADSRLPEEFATLRRLLEARLGKQGKREFVQVLRLMEAFRIEEVTFAVRDAIARGALSVDAVKHLLLCRIERRPPRLDICCDSPNWS